MKFINWLIENKEWVFSGIGILVISSIGAVIKRLLFEKRRIKETDKIVIKQSIEGSNNIQVGIQNNYGVRSKENG